MTKKIIISISILLNISLILVIFLNKDKSIFVSTNKIQREYQKTDFGEKIYTETEFGNTNNPKYQKTIVNSEIFTEYSYFEDGSVKEETHYKNGLKHGYCILYHPNTNINKSTRYENGEIKEIIKYYNNGNIKELSVAESDKIRLITTYYKNGFIESEGKMILSKNGNRTFYDRWIWYNSDVTLKKEKVFRKNM